MANANPKIHRIRRGMTLPILGAPEGGAISDAPASETLGILAEDYIGLKPSMKVKVGDVVKRGQPLFEDRRNPGVPFTAPGAGVVSAIHRGDQRVLQSVVLTLNDADAAGDEAAYSSWRSGGVQAMSCEELRALLIDSGMWTAFRTRPFSRIPAADGRPRSIFVTAMDSNPLAPPPASVVVGQESLLRVGLEALVKLADGRDVHLCRAGEAASPVEDVQGVSVHAFSGAHPAGTIGIHIHRIDPVNRERTVWHIGYQDVIAIGGLVSTGKLHLEKVISLAGPAVANPALYRVRQGVSVDALVAGALQASKTAVISGSIFNGRRASGAVLGFLGRYDNQVTALADEAPRRFLGWLAPGWNSFSVTNLFLSRLMPGKQFGFTTDRNGGHRTMIPFASYDKVNSFDLMPAFLLRALLSKDLENAEELGCLELDEEDVALFTFVCPSKIEFGPALREVLNLIEKEG